MGRRHCSISRIPNQTRNQIIDMLQEFWEAKTGQEWRRMFRTQKDYSQQTWRKDDRRDTWRGDGHRQTPQQHRDGGESPVVRGKGKPYRGDGYGSGRPYTSEQNNGRGAPQAYSNKEIICFNCQKPGHMWYECPENKVKLNRIKMPMKNYQEPKLKP